MGKVSIEKFDTQYAKLNEEDIYIQRAASGRKGYTCIGCKRPMEAVRQTKNPGHKSFFRHVMPRELKKDFHCDFDGRRYLERIVEAIIIDKGFITLPEVLKFPPPGSSTRPVLLQEAKELRPTKIKAQQTFSIDDSYRLSEEKEFKVSLKPTSIRPDITFFDEKDQPILFIEIVFTHPIDDEKKGKLIHFGVDTIQIDLPQIDKETLKSLVDAGNNNKWVFNNEEFYTDYFSFTGEIRRPLQSVDQEQRKLYEEAFNCRKTRIREFVRSIEGYLESDQFNKIEEDFRTAITRVKELTETAKSRLAESEREQEKELYSEFAQEEKKHAESETRERADSAKLKCRYYELEERYSRKAGELNEAELSIRRRERHLFGTENPGRNLPYRISAISSDIERISKKGELEKNKAEERRIDEQLAEFDRIEKQLGL